MQLVRHFAILLLVSLAAVPGLAAAAPPPPATETRTAESGRPRTLAVIPFYTPERMWQLYTPLIDYLRRETGEPWELKLYPTHDALLKGVCGGETDVALLGPAPLGRAYRTCGALPFLVALGKDGQPYYHAMLLTGDPAITAVAHLRGRTFGLLKGSTAAHVLPLHMLRAAGLGAGSVTPVFFESQDRIITALLAREVAGGGVKEALYRRFEQQPLRLLQTSEPLPNFAFAAPASQAPALRERFVAALTRLRPLVSATDAATVRLWDDEVRNGFTRPGPGFLESVLRIDDIGQAVMHESR